MKSKMKFSAFPTNEDIDDMSLEDPSFDPYEIPNKDKTSSLRIISWTWIKQTAIIILWNILIIGLGHIILKFLHCDGYLH